LVSIVSAAEDGASSKKPDLSKLEESAGAANAEVAREVIENNKETAPKSRFC
jgi:hypothetical protein